MKKMISLLSILLLLVFFQIGCSKAGTPSEKPRATPLPTAIVTPEPTATPVPETIDASEVVDPDAWVITDVDHEILADEDLIGNYLYYSEQIGYRSTMYKRNLRDGSQTLIYEYDGNWSLETSDYYWSELVPDISLSPDKQTIALIDAEGLKTYNLKTKYVRIMIKKLSDSIPETETPPKWSVSGLNYETYLIDNPSWSPDGRYISFEDHGYEGSCIGMVNADSGSYVDSIPYAPITRFHWSPVNGSSYVIASSYEQDMGPNGLFISCRGNVEELVNIAPEHVFEEYIDYFDAHLSPDGRKIAFIYEIHREDYSEKMGLAISNTDGKELDPLAEGAEITDLLYDNTGNFIYYIQSKNSRQVLVRYDISNKLSTDMAAFPENYADCRIAQWTVEGYLSFSVHIKQSDSSVSSFARRFIILDLARREMIYASPIFNGLANFDCLTSRE